jgi:hypothetical protein
MAKQVEKELKKSSRLTPAEAQAENARLLAEYADSEQTLVGRLRCVSCSEKEGGFRCGYTVAVQRSRKDGRMFYCTKCLAPIANVAVDGTVKIVQP